MFRRQFSTAILVFTLLGLYACGTGPTANPTTPPAATEAPAATAAPATTEAPAATEAPAVTEVLAATEAPDGSINSLDDVRKAVIRIVSQGSFADSDGKKVEVGSGSGFIISKSGIAVTNNHVITGAGRIKVYLDGEEEARDAEVLGASECSDLAVIKIDGEDFPYLNWYEGDIKVGLKIHVAGFPDGDPEYTQTPGEISRAKSDGNTSWASVKTVLEHTASSRGGNSGGPVVDDNTGQVIGIHYAGQKETDQHFAIGRDEALKIIDQLRAGTDVASIGLNGEAFTTQSKSGDTLSGIWVRSIKAGSLADTARIKAGDIILKLADIPLASDGTMSAYCDIVRQNTGKTFNVQVLRVTSNQLLEGQIKGRELVVVDGPSGDQPPPATADTPAPPSALVQTQFSEADATKIRQVHDALVAQYGKPRVFETFDRGMTTRRSWPNGDRAGRLNHNRYEITIDQPNSAVSETWSAQQSTTASDYMLELNVRFPSLNPVAQVGLAFDVQDENGKQLFYTFSSDCKLQPSSRHNSSLKIGMESSFWRVRWR